MFTNKTIIILLSVFFLLVSFLIYKLYQSEKRNEQLISQLMLNKKSNAGREDDPYIAREVKNTIVKNSGDISACYKSYVTAVPAGSKQPTEGDVIVDWQIDESGRVISPAIVSSQFGDNAFKKCIIGSVKGWRFPSPPMGINKYVAHTFKFKGENKK